MAIADQAVRDAEASALFSGLEGLRGLLLAVSGGSDSTALLLIAARWAKRLKKRRKRAPKLLAVTVDHGLRPEAKREAAAVKRLARRLGIPHRTLHWRGTKPKTGLQETARVARYQLLAQAATRAGYEHILTAHTLDDQAETVLFRLARGSGLTGLAGMAHASAVPIGAGTAIFLVRPLLPVSKARLLATLKGAGVEHSEDPSNHDPRFARPRLRALMPHLAREGLDARCLARLAARMRRAEATVEFAVAAACAALAPGPWREGEPIGLRIGAIRRPSGRGGVAASRPRHCARRKRGAGRTRQARRALPGAKDGAGAAAADAGRGVGHARPAAGWSSSKRRRAGTGRARRRQPPLYEMTVE